MVTIYFKQKLFQETLFQICQKVIGMLELKVKEDKLITLPKEALSDRQVQTTRIINHKLQV